MGSATKANLNHIILGLGTFFSPVNILSKQNHVMCRGMGKSRRLKVRCYTAHLIDLNEYLAEFPGAKASDKIGETELN